MTHKIQNYKGIILRYLQGCGWEYDGNYYDHLWEAEAAIDEAQGKS